MRDPLRPLAHSDMCRHLPRQSCALLSNLRLFRSCTSAVSGRDSVLIFLTDEERPWNFVSLVIQDCKFPF
jgi:hypothetical protein